MIFNFFNRLPMPMPIYENMKKSAPIDRQADVSVDP